MEDLRVERNWMDMFELWIIDWAFLMATFDPFNIYNVIFNEQLQQPMGKMSRLGRNKAAVLTWMDKYGHRLAILFQLHSLRPTENNDSQSTPRDQLIPPSRHALCLDHREPFSFHSSSCLPHPKIEWRYLRINWKKYYYENMFTGKRSRVTRVIFCAQNNYDEC